MSPSGAKDRGRRLQLACRAFLQICAAASQLETVVGLLSAAALLYAIIGLLFAILLSLPSVDSSTCCAAWQLSFRLAILRGTIEFGR